MVLKLAAMASVTSGQEFSAFTVSKALKSSRIKRRRRRMVMVVNAKGKEDNRKQLQKGRNLSIESIQAVQSLKRAYYFSTNSNLDSVFRSKFSRLLKLDMLSVLRELLRQNHCLLALKVFKDIRKEYWYKPQVSLYDDMIKAMASNGYFEQVELLCIYLKTETNLIEPETDAFNALFTTLITFNLSGFAMEFYGLMKAVKCEPDRLTFRILINGLESMGESSASAILRQDAHKFYGQSLEFLEEEEDEG
ncbi:pentatricopeptide repeat-containing protein At1g62350 [Ricinus communis]|uniref:Pentatricopeptide repeat-containing protein n=1 Tax=Ricinus communis TaxID=3988 RepID=B9RKY5_RICCO|nr:pentatricopeptide repeat-containing protein At1g62350 [Ricinus communis]EEF48000.1 conserved hypothetical protein [Ricinus communis]|eukprot:XP_002514404.1 pentatricopeptide repeat-containing protein At1g62350 [Ricinus communis]